MTCRELIDFLAAYLDGELAPAERSAFEAHLAVCPHCVDYLASYRTTILLEKQAFGGEAEVPEEVPPELVSAILDARGKR